MWSKYILLGLVFPLFMCNGKTNDDHNKFKEDSVNSSCVYAGSSYKRISKIINYFNIKLDEVEKEGVDFYFLINDTTIEFAFWSLSSGVKEEIVKTGDNVFFIPKKNVYLGIKFDEEDRKHYVWIEKSKTNLFKEYEMIGSVSKKETPASCLDRTKISQIYEQAKRDLKAGPALDGADPEVLRKRAEAEEKANKKK